MKQREVSSGMNDKKHDYLKRYQLVLTTIGPVFVGDGKKIEKKEYAFLPKNKIGVVDIEKMYMFLKRKRLDTRFEEYMLQTNERRNLSEWLRDTGVVTSEWMPHMKYVVDGGDIVAERGRALEIEACIKDPYGKAYVPGSSIKGMLRTILLSADMLQHPKKYEAILDEVRRNMQIQKEGKGFLERDQKRVQEACFHILQRGEKVSDAVNDVLSGLIVSDSEPIDMDRIALCQKWERKPDGTMKSLNLLRECIVPGTEIKCELTIDTSVLDITVENIQASVKHFITQYYRNFSKQFVGLATPRINQIYLGGGVGFVSKTVVYPAFGREEGMEVAQKVFEKTKVPRQHKHDRDGWYGASPHIIKCTKYRGEVLQMGLCALKITDFPRSL